MDGWADVAQYTLALTGLVALIFAYVEVREGRNAARRARVYEYADAFNTIDLLLAGERHREQWPNWTLADLNDLPREERAQAQRLPNIVEEVAYLYNHDALDQDVAAELLGIYVEALWQASEHLVREIRQIERRPRVYIEWERMQNDTWRRRGAPGPLGVEPPDRPPPNPAASRLRLLLSAECRREVRTGRRLARPARAIEM